MDLFLIVYFLVGVIQDFLLTLNWRYVAKEKPLGATFFSFSTSVIGMVIFYNIVTRLDSDRSIIAIIVYSFGIAAGTFLAMKLKISKDRPVDVDRISKL
ncbi:MAG: hypothetical protein HY764_02175 [Candidatus Portnoybacteria bacterium]|nr:hypothetical protein [Candidatus Portnoybacteria bacterium]